MGVSDDRLKELQGPSLMSVVNRYYQLWMQEKEWEAKSNILNNHRDADKIPQETRDEATATWKQDMEARIAFKKEFIIKAGRIGSEAVDTSAVDKANKDANDKAVAQAKAQAQATSGAVTAQAGENAQNAQGVQVKVNGGGGTGAGATGGNATGAVSPTGGTGGTGAGATPSNAVGVQATPQAQGAHGAGELEALEAWLINTFVPALAGEIAKQMPTQQASSQPKPSQQGAQPKQATMGAPKIYR